MVGCKHPFIPQNVVLYSLNMKVTRKAGGSNKLSLRHLKNAGVFTGHIHSTLKLINYQ